MGWRRISVPAARVMVLYNAPTLPADHPDAVSERDVLATAETVIQELREAGYRVEPCGVGRDPLELLTAVRAFEPEAVFNLFEGLAIQGQTEAYAAGLLDWLGIPFTGCPMPAMILARDKLLCKTLLRGAGLPTAPGFAVSALPLVQQPAAWPVIVKPMAEDASVGIDYGSVVETPDALERRLQYLLDRYRPPFLVESFIDGREFNVGVIDDPEPAVLPLAEIVFDRGVPGSWPIVTYTSKWAPGSVEDLAALPKCPAEVESGLTKRLEELALQAYRLVGCRDYARIDVRVDHAGQPWILEINPNPDYGPGAGLARMLETSGRRHEQMTVRMIERCLARSRQ